MKNKPSKRKLFSNKFTLILLLILLLVIGFNLGVRIEKTPLLQNGDQLIFAHRGISNYYIENSTESFDAVAEIGLQAIEIDVSQTKDNRLIVFHDKNCNRLLGIDTHVDKLMFEDIRSKFLLYKQKTTINKVLALEEFILRYGKSHIVYLDVKRANKSVADSLIHLFKKHNLYDSALIADENFSFLSYIKIRSPKIKTSLEGFSAGKEFLHYIIPKRLAPDYYSSFLSKIDNDFVAFLNKKEILDRYIAYGVDSTNIVTTNKLEVQNIIIDYSKILGYEHHIENYVETLKKNE